jgi:hypothetical protein
MPAMGLGAATNRKSVAKQRLNICEAHGAIDSSINIGAAWQIAAGSR